MGTNKSICRTFVSMTTTRKSICHCITRLSTPILVFLGNERLSISTTFAMILIIDGAILGALNLFVPQKKG